jgi:hypothetical protein
MFKQQSSHYAVMRRREQIMASVSPYLYSEDKNVRQAAVTVLLNYSVAFLLKEDEEGRVQAISALSEAIPNETDLQTMLRMATALGNFAHENKDARSMVETFGIKFPANEKLKLA